MAQESGIHLKGHAPSLEVMRRYRVCVAPLRFGAGLKGKIVDSWRHGLPVATTPIGAEGMGACGGCYLLQESCLPRLGSPNEARGRTGWKELFAKCTQSGEGGAAQLLSQSVSHKVKGRLALQAVALIHLVVDAAGEAWGGLWEGVVADEIARDCHRLYTDPHLWLACKSQGRSPQTDSQCDSCQHLFGTGCLGGRERGVPLACLGGKERGVPLACHRCFADLPLWAFPKCYVAPFGRDCSPVTRHLLQERHFWVRCTTGLQISKRSR